MGSVPSSSGQIALVTWLGVARAGSGRGAGVVFAIGGVSARGTGGTGLGGGGGDGLVGGAAGVCWPSRAHVGQLPFDAS
jgi:hypothetical protein